MASKGKSTPKMNRHKATGQAYVRIGGRFIYLGKWGTPEAKQAYARIISEWETNGQRLQVDPKVVTITELIAEYWEHVDGYYRKIDGTSTREAEHIKAALRPLKGLYGLTPARDFGPLALKTVRTRMIEAGWSRPYINKQVSRIRRMFRWAVENEKVSVEVHTALATVTGLKRGRTEAREVPDVKPVDEGHIEAIRPHVSQQVWALIQLQILTAARPGELLELRPQDVDTSGDIWTAEIVDHKTAYRGRRRTLYIGPTAQAVLRPFLLRPDDSYLFSPQDAERERYAQAETHRRPNQKDDPRKTGRKVGECYTIFSYRKAIVRACEQAGVPRWTPYQLRHNAATRLRKEFGLEAAQVILGHSRADVTQVYAERDEQKALDIISKIG